MKNYAALFPLWVFCVVISISLVTKVQSGNLDDQGQGAQSLEDPFAPLLSFLIATKCTYSANQANAMAFKLHIPAAVAKAKLDTLRTTHCFKGKGGKWELREVAPSPPALRERKLVPPLPSGLALSITNENLTHLTNSEQKHHRNTVDSQKVVEKDKETEERKKQEVDDEENSLVDDSDEESNNPNDEDLFSSLRLSASSNPASNQKSIIQLILRLKCKLVRGAIFKFASGLGWPYKKAYDTLYAVRKQVCDEVNGVWLMRSSSSLESKPNHDTSRDRVAFTAPEEQKLKELLFKQECMIHINQELHLLAKSMQRRTDVIIRKLKDIRGRVCERSDKLSWIIKKEPIAVAPIAYSRRFTGWNEMAERAVADFIRSHDCKFPLNAVGALSKTLSRSYDSVINKLASYRLKMCLKASGGKEWTLRPSFMAPTVPTRQPSADAAPSLPRKKEKTQHTIATTASSSLPIQILAPAQLTSDDTSPQTSAVDGHILSLSAPLAPSRPALRIRIKQKVIPDPLMESDSLINPASASDQTRSQSRLSSPSPKSEFAVQPGLHSSEVLSKSKDVDLAGPSMTEAIPSSPPLGSDSIEIDDPSIESSHYFPLPLASRQEFADQAMESVTPEHQKTKPMRITLKSRRTKSARNLQDDSPGRASTPRGASLLGAKDDEWPSTQPFNAPSTDSFAQLMDTFFDLDEVSSPKEVASLPFDDDIIDDYFSAPFSFTESGTSDTHRSAVGSSSFDVSPVLHQQAPLDRVPSIDLDDILFDGMDEMNLPAVDDLEFEENVQSVPPQQAPSTEEHDAFMDDLDTLFADHS